MTQRFPRIFSAIVCAGIASACVAPLDEKTAKEFEAVSVEAASVVGLPSQMQRQLWAETRTHERQCAYLRGRSYDLATPKSRAPVTKLAQAQAAAGRSLKAYVQTLVDASRGESLAKPEAAGAGFAASVTEFGTSANIDAPVGDIVAAGLTLVQRLGESRRQERIREVMSGAIDPLFQLERLLKRDVAQVTRETESFVVHWDKEADCFLAANRLRPDALTRFDDLSKRRARIGAELGAVRNGPKLIRQLRKAHIEVVTSEKDLADVLVEVTAILKEIDVLVSLVTTREGAT